MVNVLVVDPSHNSYLLTKDLLSPYGERFVHCADVYAADVVIIKNSKKKKKFGLIIADVGTNALGAFLMMNAIFEQEPRPWVVRMSMHVSDKHRYMCMGMDDFVVKPLTAVEASLMMSRICPAIPEDPEPKKCVLL